MTLRLYVICGLTLLSLAAPRSMAAQEQTDPGALPLFDFETGEPRKLEHLQGKIVVLNFWATWCKPCLEEMPLLISLQERYRGQGVQVIGASADLEDTRDRIPEFIRRLGINFPVWVGATAEHMEALGLPGMLPATVVLDQEGGIAGRIAGVLQEGEVERYLDWLLKRPADRVERREEDEDRHAHDGHEHDREEAHHHGGVGLEGASTVPS